MGLRAWVCSGGAALGSWQAGALHYAASKIGLPDVLVGTSAGALNAAALSFCGIDGLKKFWMDISGIGDLFTPIPDFEAFMHSGPLAKLIDQAITGKTPAVETVITYTDLDSGLTCYASTKDGDLETFKWQLLASASVPGLISPVDHRYVDGGVRQNFPVRKALELGATDITMFSCHPLKLKQETGRRSLEKVLLRSYDCMANELMWGQLLINQPGIISTVIMPDDKFDMGAMEFKPKAIRAAFLLGETAAQAVLG